MSGDPAIQALQVTYNWSGVPYRLNCDAYEIHCFKVGSEDRHATRGYLKADKTSG